MNKSDDGGSGSQGEGLILQVSKLIAERISSENNMFVARKIDILKIHGVSLRDNEFQFTRHSVFPLINIEDHQY